MDFETYYDKLLNGNDYHSFGYLETAIIYYN